MPRSTLLNPALVELAHDAPAVDTIIWVDPGKSTGWALWDTTGRFASGQHDAQGVENLLYLALMRAATWYQVGWEDYLITGSPVRHDGSALRVIGFLEWVTRYTGCGVLKPMPSSARRLGSDANLDALGWRVPGRRDANAAAAHLLAHLLRERLLPASQLRLLVGDGDRGDG